MRIVVSALWLFEPSLCIYAMLCKRIAIELKRDWMALSVRDGRSNRPTEHLDNHRMTRNSSSKAFAVFTLSEIELTSFTTHRRERSSQHKIYRIITRMQLLLENQPETSLQGKSCKWTCERSTIRLQRVKREQERGICDRTTIQNTRTAAATNYQKQKK